MPTTVMCFLQESSAMPHLGAGGASASARPGLTAGPGGSVPALETGVERGGALHPSAWCKALRWWPLSSLPSWEQRWACYKSSSALAPRAVPVPRGACPRLRACGTQQPREKTRSYLPGSVFLKRQQWEGGNRKMLHKGLLKWIAEIWHDTSESLMKSVLPLCASQALYLYFSYNIILLPQGKMEVISLFFTPV